MKIIAVASSDKFIVEISVHEIAQVMGFKNSYDSNFDRAQVKVGLDVPVESITKSAHYLRTLDKGTLKNVQTLAEEIVKDLEGLRETVQKINLFDTLKGNERKAA